MGNVFVFAVTLLTWVEDHPIVNWYTVLNVNIIVSYVVYTGFCVQISYML